MKTKLYWVALLASAALIAQAQAGGQRGGGHGGGGRSAASGPAPGRGGSAPSFHSMPARNFGAGRMIYSGQRFSPAGRQLPSSPAFRQAYNNSNRSASIRAAQLNRGNININRGDRSPRLSNGGNRAVANPRHQGNAAGQVRSKNNLPTNWRNHVVAQHSANWHRDWDRRRDHTWHGHHCRFIDGSWVIFDFGFYPWQYWYPYDYYAPYYYAEPYGYDPGYEESGVYPGEEYYDQNGSIDQSNESTVAAAQEQLAGQGYYRGEIDGVFGLETRRAVTRYQSDQGLRVTGSLNTDTLDALGLARVATN